MPQVDLTAILPALKEAVEPFEKALAQAEAVKINPGTVTRTYAPLANLPIGALWKLIESVQAVRRMAGDIS